MRISTLIESTGLVKSNHFVKDFEVKGISCNSKQISDDFIFVAIKGARQDGNKFIGEAIKNGARAVVIQGSRLRFKVVGGINFVYVKDARKVLAKLAAEFYGNPSSGMKVVGVTGTNGKTTVTYLLEAILKEANFSPAVIGTINYRFKGRVIPSTNTTPGPIELGSLLAQMLKKGINYVIIEVSSHALDQDRTGGIKFDSAIFTNLTQDHLDYHKTFGAYFKAKAKLFKNLKSDAFAVINKDDPWGRRVMKLTDAKVIGYAIQNKADISARQIKFQAKFTEFSIASLKGRVDFKTRLLGKHNVYNVLAAISWAIKSGISHSVIKRAIEKFYLVPGRMERIDSKGGFSVFVDYAHTEDGLEKVISALRQLFKNRIIVVFGCGGERDKGKRPKMGRVVTELADYAIITNDNPRSEEPQRIIYDIKKGIRKNNYCVIPKRLEAIKKSLSMAKKGDAILVAGKGHENYQILKNRTLHFDDREAIRECLRSMN